jgi:hypothetical protein
MVVNVSQDTATHLQIDVAGEHSEVSVRTKSGAFVATADRNEKYSRLTIPELAPWQGAVVSCC